MPLIREVKPEKRAFVESLPRRVAHAVHALLECQSDLTQYGPYTAAEVMLYDAEAMSPKGTAAALREGWKKGLAINMGRDPGLWTPTLLARDHRNAFEERYLRETEDL